MPDAPPVLRRLMFAWVYVFPWPLCVGSAVAAYVMTRNGPFAAYVLLLPVIYGYVAPGIATNLLHNWHFNGPFRMGHYYIHHGVMYAGNMMPLLLIAMLGVTPTEFGIARAISIVLSTAALHGFVLWIHDIGIVRCGFVTLFNRPAREGRSPAEIVAHYAPLCFSLIGAGYATGAVLAYHQFVVRGANGFTAQLWPLLIGIGLTFTLPSLAYRWMES